MERGYPMIAFHKMTRDVQVVVAKSGVKLGPALETCVYGRQGARLRNDG